MGHLGRRMMAGVLLVVLGGPGVAAETYSVQGQPLFRFDPPAGWFVREGADVPASAMPARVFSGNGMRNGRNPDFASVRRQSGSTARDHRAEREVA